MEKKYRLLDMGEDYRDGDEILTVSNGWQRISGCGTVQAHTVPMRRPDDGKGKCVIVNDCSGEDYWKWGVGWVQANSVYPYASLSYVWRKPREVEKPKEQESNWVVFGQDDDIVGLFKSEKEAMDHIVSSELMFDEKHYIAKIVKTVVVKMIVKEVGK